MHRPLLSALVLVLTLTSLCCSGAADVPTGPRARVVTLFGVGGNGIMGVATITPERGAATSRVVVELRGLAAGTLHAGHVHRGTCARPGAIDVPLAELTADADGVGLATTTGVHSGMLGAGYSLQYHVTQASLSTPIACGDLSGPGSSGRTDGAY